MKHNVPVTFLLILIFFVAQLFGLFVLSYASTVNHTEEGTVSVDYGSTAVGDRPELEGPGSFLYVVFAIAFGTILVLILRKFKKVKIWRTWFMVAVFFCVFIALSALLGNFINRWIIGLFAAAIAVWKIHKPNVIIHNISEILLYSGIAYLIAPMFDLRWASLLLVAISLYDAYAVWHSKHMVDMATFQSESNLFAGLFIPYETKGKGKIHLKIHKHSDAEIAVKHAAHKTLGKTQTLHRAILGGGDIAFPLIFSGAVFTWLIQDLWVGKLGAFAWSLFPVVGATVALGLLFFYSRKGKFYPAMPFISAGCFIGLGLLWLFI